MSEFVLSSSVMARLVVVGWLGCVRGWVAVVGNDLKRKGQGQVRLVVAASQGLMRRDKRGRFGLDRHGEFEAVV